MRYLRLFRSLLSLSWRTYPRTAAAAVAIKVLMLGTAAATALALRAGVDAAIAHNSAGAAIGAAAAALIYALLVYLEGQGGVLHFLVLERTGLLHLMPRIDTDLTQLDSLDHLERTDLLDRISLVRGGAWSLMFGTWAALDAMFQVGQLVILLVLLVTVSPWLLVLIPLAAVPVWCDHRGRRVVSRAQDDTEERFRVQRHLFNLATAADSGKEIRVSAAGPELTRRQAQAWNEVADRRFRARLRAAGIKLTGWAIFTAGYVGGLLFVIHQASRGAASAGDVVLTLTVAISLRQTVQETVHRAGQAGHESRLVDPYLWLRDYVATERARPAGTAPSPTALRDGISLTGVTYRYPGTERPAVDDLTVRLPAGSVVAVVGEYGSGKTTLVKLLGKLYRPDSGVIAVDGTDLADLETAGWRARMSAAFQDFGRFHTTFAVTVGLGDLARLEDRDRIREAVALADAEELVARLPDGLDTQLGRRLGGVELSEGQWQKTALARASMRTEPLLFVLDEPTASLDAPSEHTIFTRYMRRARDLAARTGAVTVVVSHRFSTVADADLILVLDQGRLVEHGSHANLIAAGGRYADLYGIQATAYA